MANMNIDGSWKDKKPLIEYLGGQLVAGRLAIVLGAGISQFYGLPSWTTLINRLCAINSEPDLAPGADPLLKADVLKKRYYAGNNAAFSKAVHDALYQDTSGDFEEIRQNTLLSAIGALAMASSRGSASSIVTFNYDNLLELFLEYHGYVTSSVHSPKHWQPNQDVVVYHPHGLLSLDSTPGDSTEIVLGTSEYLSILASTLWKPILQTLFRRHTFLYIGLSGADLHMQSIVNDLKENHVITNERVRYHGVRFVESASVDLDTETMYQSWGVYTHQVASFSKDLPQFLFEVCQAARKQRGR